jgi:hypothetical protein
MDEHLFFHDEAQLQSLIRRSAWQTRAACRGRSDVNFFPHRGESIRAAIGLCSGCSVRTECLEEALAHHGTLGVWGGMTERERKRLKRRKSLPDRASAAAGGVR